MSDLWSKGGYFGREYQSNRYRENQQRQQESSRRYRDSLNQRSQVSGFNTGYSSGSFSSGASFGSFSGPIDVILTIVFITICFCGLPVIAYSYFMSGTPVSSKQVKAKVSADKSNSQPKKTTQKSTKEAQKKGDCAKWTTYTNGKTVCTLYYPPMGKIIVTPPKQLPPKPVSNKINSPDVQNK